MQPGVFRRLSSILLLMRTGDNVKNVVIDTNEDCGIWSIA